MLAHTDIFYVKSYKSIVYAGQFSVVSIFLSWPNCLISLTFVYIGWMPANIKLGASDCLSFRIITDSIWDSSLQSTWMKITQQSTFWTGDFVASNSKNHWLVTQAYLFNPDRNLLLGRKCVTTSQVCIMWKVFPGIKQILSIDHVQAARPCCQCSSHRTCDFSMQAFLKFFLHITAKWFLPCAVLEIFMYVLTWTAGLQRSFCKRQPCWLLKNEEKA